MYKNKKNNLEQQEDKETQKVHIESLLFTVKFCMWSYYSQQDNSNSNNILSTTIAMGVQIIN